MKKSHIFSKTIILITVLIFCLSLTAFADEKPVSVYVNNQKIEFDVNPIIENGRTLVPLRGVFENLGAQVDWNKNIMQVVIKDGNNDVSMLLNKNKVLVNGEIKDIDVATKMINSRTFAPLRFISETLGHDVKWDQNTYSVYITEKTSEPVNKNIIPTVGSKENMIALLEYNSKLYNYIGIYRAVDINTEETTSAPVAESAGNADNSLKDSSNTNNQVDGVEEGDIIKNDGQYIYVNSYNSVKIIDSNPTSPKVIGVVQIPENTGINEIFVSENKLVIIGQNNFYRAYEDKMMNISIMPPMYYEDRVNVLIYDITNKAKPILEREFLFDGSYSSGRTIDNNLYLVTTKYLNLGYDYYNNKEMEIKLPSFTDVIKNETTEIGYDKIKYFPNYVDSKYMFTIGINLEDKTKEIDVDTYLGSTNSIYVSKDSMYAAVSDYSYEPMIKSTDVFNPVYSSSTVLYKFSLSNATISPVGQGEVPGTIINQFSMDEHENNFRITTTSEDLWMTGQNESKNNVYILDENLKVTGKLEGIAPGERIYSTRFMGEKMYMVTFKQVDPLFVIDTSDASNPKILGSLKIPGYSTYLHPVDENHILGFGYDMIENQWGGQQAAGLKISLFDVTNVSKPREIKSEVIGKSGTFSELLYNHKALMFNLNKGLMSFPITRTSDNYKTDFVGAYVYNVNADSFNLKTKLSHMDLQDGYDYGYEIKRVIYIGDYLYSFSDNEMQIHKISNNTKVSDLDIK